MIRPGWDEYFATMAMFASTRSTCSRLAVGAVLVHDKRIIATGYNGVPAGEPHCEHLDDVPCTRAVHAELNALDHADVVPAGATLYVTHAPCLACAEGIAVTAITRVVYRVVYRNRDGLDYLRNAGIEVS